MAPYARRRRARAAFGRRYGFAIFSGTRSRTHSKQVPFERGTPREYVKRVVKRHLRHLTRAAGALGRLTAADTFSQELKVVYS